MATALTSAPPRPTSISGVKGFAGNVGDKFLWVAAAMLALGLFKVAAPYISKVPVVGALMGSSPAGAAMDTFGTQMGA